MKRKFPRGFACVLIAMCFLFVASAQAQNRTVKVGDTDVILPEIDGFADVYGQNPDLDATILHEIPPGGKLLAFYLSSDDFASVMRPKRGFRKSIIVYVSENEKPVSDENSFKIIKEEFANVVRDSPSWKNDAELAAAMKSASTYANNKYHRKSDAAFGEAHSLGTIVDTPKALSMAIVANLEVTNSTGHHSRPQAAALSVLNLNSRIVFAYIFCRYHNGADLDFVSQSAKQFVTKAVALNSGAEAPAGAGSAPERK